MSEMEKKIEEELDKFTSRMDDDWYEEASEHQLIKAAMTHGYLAAAESMRQELEDARKIIKFYSDATGNPKQYMRQGTMVYNLKKAIFIDGGERAREFLAKWGRG
jgi:hypothetical protein